MILISHRGNINGKIPEKENEPISVEKTLRLGYDVEIDVWLVDHGFYLGHDSPKYQVSYDWFFMWSERMWIHCKNIEVLKFLLPSSLNYFWHESDTITITNRKFIWAFPGKQPINGSIAVLPELNNDDISQCVGICSDVIAKYNDSTNSF